jgi:hypothetical protein
MTIKDEFLLWVAYITETVKALINDIGGPKPPFGHA